MSRSLAPGHGRLGLVTRASKYEDAAGLRRCGCAQPLLTADRGRLRRAPAVGLSQCLDVAEHAQMDLVDEPVREDLPVAPRPHPVAVPGRPDEPGAAAG